MQQRERFGSTRRFEDLISGLLEKAPFNFPNRRFVVDDENNRRCERVAGSHVTLT